MTRLVPPAESEDSQTTVDALHALYRDAAGDEPAPALDRAILDAARAEVRPGGASKRRTPWWKRWLPATAALAVAVMGLSLTWRVMDEQERRLREEMAAPKAAHDSAEQAPAAERPIAAPRLPDAAAPAVATTRRDEPAATIDAPPRVSGSLATPAPAPAAEPVPREALKKSRRAESEQMPERRDVDAAAESVAGGMRQAGKLEAKSLGAASGADEAAPNLARPATQPASVPAVPVADAATPDAWLKRIRELRAAGRHAEALQSLARFRLRYPEFALPDDLLDLR